MVETSIKVAIGRSGSLRGNDPGNSCVDAVILLMKGKVPLVITCHEGGVRLSAWLVGLSPRALLKRRGGRAFAFNGPIAGAGAELRRPEILLQSVRTLFARYRISEIDIRSYALNRLKGEDLGGISEEFAVRSEDFSTFVNQIADVQTLVERLPPDRRRLYRIGLEDKLGFRAGVSAYEMIKLTSGAYSRRGDKLALASKLRLAIFWILSKLSKAVRIFGIYVDGQIQSYAVVQTARGRGVYLYGGSIDKPHRAAGAFLQTEIMLQLGREGLQEYDFGGATFVQAAGVAIANFKKKFGGTETKHANALIHTSAP